MPDLPELSQIEEMLIARVHVLVQVNRIRGQQFKYKGHIVNFMRNTARVFNRLPLLPSDLEVILLRPLNTDSDPHMRRRFVKDFRVRRQHVLDWLCFLRRHHPGYKDIEISGDALSQLPVNDVVQVMTEETNPDTGGRQPVVSGPVDLGPDPGECDPIPETVTVPNYQTTENEMVAIRRQLQPTHQLTMPSFRSTPLSELNRMPLVSWAFPTLFPRGGADYAHPRMRGVSYAEYAKHLMRYEDGRFAKHPRFRYVLFNTLMRGQASRSAGFYSKQRELPELEELQALFENEDPESEAVLRSMTRFAAALRGTRPFWGKRRRDLTAFVKNLGPAHLFVTLSAADLHWEDLMRHLPRYDE
ncbi:hypothetical protein CNMCM5793_006913 [Aspergillus hiratsukae]|uniref:Helitron helicase-like domain-containing protein n=1 Tax=Aspergillus hiratsukae TaxID=1194566 RepID=A0A8H6QJC9_9EURO|nr:hypothetical protein CNMCM5793_006913 [Aspergillus hiratsukae]KAF7173829.1 hypothetical protein CNMCM6106_007939 [Aspergillus hiratsukae]